MWDRAAGRAVNFLLIGTSILLASNAYAGKHHASAEGGREYPVPDVIELRVVIQKSNPPTLAVKAVGEVPTSGWAHPRLVMRTPGIVPDGVFEFDFVARPPSNGSSPVVSKVKAEANFQDESVSFATAVRVYGANNALVYEFRAKNPKEGGVATLDVGPEGLTIWKETRNVLHGSLVDVQHEENRVEIGIVPTSISGSTSLPQAGLMVYFDGGPGQPVNLSVPDNPREKVGERNGVRYFVTIVTVGKSDAGREFVKLSVSGFVD